MKIYKVKVNDKVYEVQVEAVDEVAGNIKVESPATAPVSVSSDSKTINAPIAGKVIDVKVNVGDHVEANQTVAIIEAMKLENEIQAVESGTVKQVLVKAGDDVKNKDALIILG